MTAPLLATDLYQLTMVQSYLEHGLTDQASFEFFVRKLPEQRNYLVACGIDPLVDELLALSATDEELEWLAASGRFSEQLIDYLADFRFSGDVEAVAEGEIVFAGEPVLRVTAPLPMAQLVETLVINRLHLAMLVASKASRMRLACPDGLLVDFGLRRTHGLDAGLAAARAGFIAGLDGTSNVEAGQKLGIPVFGTMAHSFVQAHESEREAFLHFARSHPENTVLLIDTYDTLNGAVTAVEAAGELAREGIRIRGVRIDSGDLLELSRAVREILDAAGLNETTIFASGNLDEWRIDRLVQEGAPIQGFGIGTKMNTSADHPYLDCAYKLQMYSGRPKYKLSEGKATLPGIKQVWRRIENGVMAGDVISTPNDAVEGEPLIRPLVRNGTRLHPPIPLDQAREFHADRRGKLPDALRTLKRAESPYSVEIGPALARLMDELGIPRG